MAKTISIETSEEKHIIYEYLKNETYPYGFSKADK